MHILATLTVPKDRYAKSLIGPKGQKIESLKSNVKTQLDTILMRECHVKFAVIVHRPEMPAKQTDKKSLPTGATPTREDEDEKNNEETENEDDDETGDGDPTPNMEQRM